MAAASPGDTINVAPGAYDEDVVIGKSLPLAGAGASNTIIDATGLANGVYADGIDNPGLSEVTGVVTSPSLPNPSGAASGKP